MLNILTTLPQFGANATVPISVARFGGTNLANKHKFVSTLSKKGVCIKAMNLREHFARLPTTWAPVKLIGNEQFLENEDAVGLVEKHIAKTIEDALTDTDASSLSGVSISKCRREFFMSFDFAEIRSGACFVFFVGDGACQAFVTYTRAVLGAKTDIEEFEDVTGSHELCSFQFQGASSHPTPAASPVLNFGSTPEPFLVYRGRIIPEAFIYPENVS